jgi:hypothetical protein
VGSGAAYASKQRTETLSRILAHALGSSEPGHCLNCVCSVPARAEETSKGHDMEVQTDAG